MFTNLPEEKHSHGLRRHAAVESVRGSFEEAAAAITRATGVTVGKRQVEELARRAAADVEAFYAARRPGPAPDDEVLVLTCPDYLTAKKPCLDYATALAGGWPIATGVIEGACRHLVKDRRHHRRQMGTGRRRSHPQAPRPDQQWRLRPVLGPSPCVSNTRECTRS